MTSAEAAAVDESFHDLPLELAVQARAQVHEQSDTPLAEPWTLATWPHVPTRVLVGCGDRVLPVPASVDSHGHTSRHPIFSRRFTPAPGHLVTEEDVKEWRRATVVDFGIRLRHVLGSEGSDGS